MTGMVEQAAILFESTAAIIARTDRERNMVAESALEWDVFIKVSQGEALPVPTDFGVACEKEESEGQILTDVAK